MLCSIDQRADETELILSERRQDWRIGLLRAYHADRAPPKVAGLPIMAMVWAQNTTISRCTVK